LVDVEFYFHYGCPWTYLAFTRLRETAMRTRARIVWKPILIERVRQATGGGEAEDPGDAKARYSEKDLQDWARFCGVAIRRGGPYPVAAEWAARGAIPAIAASLAEPYGEAMFRACFADGADLANAGVVTGLAGGVGLDVAGFREAAASDAARRALEANSDELVRRGGFGSPTMFVGDDMYVGNDRMPLVELALVHAAERPLIVPGAHGQM
jgi:2-hydroxychromene-2-carboxylate isomerase